MNKRFYKTTDLFGNEKINFVQSATKKQDLFSNYEEFLEKFEIKKTTDDCYTPDDVYQLILNHINQFYDLKNKNIIRPFYPGGDYQNIQYNENCIVIDNPPFSIIAQITRFYIKNKISFFLFAPHLTNFGSDIDVTHVVVGADITYANGATIKTSFLSNLYGDIKIYGDADLATKFKILNKNNKVNLPKYIYPENVLTVSDVAWIVDKGISIKINKNSVKHCRSLNSQKLHKKAIFGSGFLISERAAAERAAAERAAAERENVIVWELSQKEIEIIKKLE